jgi:hypothetical protein
MKKWFMAMCFVLAMLLGACGGPGSGDGTQEPDGNKQNSPGTKSLTIKFDAKGKIPLEVWNFRVMSKPVILQPGAQTSITLKEPQTSVVLPVKALQPGYVHPAEISSDSIIAKSGEMTVISGEPIPWLFRTRRFSTKGSVAGILVTEASIDKLHWSDQKELVTDSGELYITANSTDPDLISAFSEGLRINVQFRRDGNKFIPVSSNLKSITVRYLRDSQVPQTFKNVFGNIPKGASSKYRYISPDATWEVTLEGTDKQGRPFKKSYYALVAKPY